MTAFYERMPYPPQGSIAEAAILLFVSMRRVRDYTRDALFAGLLSKSAAQSALAQKKLREVHGLEDVEEAARHQQEMSELMARWSNRGPFSVSKVATVEEMRVKILNRQRQAERTRVMFERRARDNRIPGGRRP